jgi:ribosomal protein S21
MPVRVVLTRRSSWP